MRPGQRRSAEPIARQCGSDWHTVDMEAACANAIVLRRNGTERRQDRHAGRQISASFSEISPCLSGTRASTTFPTVSECVTD
jgi:hypothetical protein